MKEVWKYYIGSIKGHRAVEIYVSNLGRLKSIDKYRNEKILKLTRGGYKGNYLKYQSTRYGVHYIHRMVYSTFVQKIPIGMEINHIDGNPKNNVISNLELTTSKENSQHRVKILKRHGQGITEAIVECVTPTGRVIKAIGVKEMVNLVPLAEQTIRGAMCYGNKPKGYSFKRIGEIKRRNING